MTSFSIYPFKRTPAPPEDSWELRQILLLGQLISLLGLALTAGFTLWPFAIVAGVGLYYGHRYAHRQRHEPSKRTRAFIFGGLHFAACFMCFGIAAGLPYPQAVMAMWGMALVSWETFSRRHIYLGWVFGLSNLYVTALLSRSTLFLIFLLLFTASFCLFLWVLERVEAEKEGFKPIHSHPAWQISQLWERTKQEWGSTRGRWLRRLALVGLLFTLPIFIFTPRFAGSPLIPPITLRIPMRGGPQGQIVNPATPIVQVQGYDPTSDNNQTGEYYHGFDTRLDLSYRGGLNRTIMMYVRSPVSSYWRSHAYDEYDGGTWVQSRPESPTVIRRPSDELSFTLTDSPPPGDRFVHTFYIQNALPNIAFVGGSPVELYFPARQIGIDDTGGIRLPETLAPNMTYSVESVSYQFDTDLLRQTGTDYPADLASQYLALPDTVTDRTRQLAADITAPHDNVYDKAWAIQEHLKNSYPYDFFPPPQASNTDAVDQFLFVDQTGFCEHYVSAMGVMLRTQGIPARLVSGFGSGTFNYATNLYEVRAMDAHAWVEVYFPTYGWVPFEPTPGWDDPNTAPVNRWVFSDWGGSLDIPTIPFGQVAETAGAAFAVLLTPILIVVACIGLWFFGRWAYNRAQIWRASQPPRYSNIDESSSERRQRRRILAAYRRAQRRQQAIRQDPETPQEHATTHPQFNRWANVVDIAAFRPEPPEDNLLEDM